MLFESDESLFSKREILNKIQSLAALKIKSVVDKKILEKMIRKRKLAKAVAQKEISLMNLAKTQHLDAVLTDISVLNSEGE